jgi:hypothetical protein
MDLTAVRLAEGDYFGERALVVDDKRSATVIAEVDVTCMVLRREEMTELLGPLTNVLDLNLGLRVCHYQSLSLPVFTIGCCFARTRCCLACRW